MSELLNKQINTVCALRKLTRLEIEQGATSFMMRPQMHLLIVKPFGTMKSSYTHKIEEAIDGDLIKIDEITKPALLGTITKDGGYVPGLAARSGGKVTVIDEFNLLNEEALKTLLPILEKQEVNRELGHAVKTPKTLEPNEWTSLTVNQGYISGKVNFSCIAFAMYYPKPKVFGSYEENPQALLGIKSRFSPNFSCPEHDELFDMLHGINCFDINDVGKGKTRHVFWSDEAYRKFLDEYYNLTKPFVEEIGKQKLGFITRISSDLIRFATHDALCEGNSDTILEISDPKYLIKNALYWTKPLLEQYMYEETNGSFDAFKNLFKQMPDEKNEFYAVRLNKSVRQIQRWKKFVEEQII